MRLLWAFLRHEAKLRIRSGGFLGLVLGYVAIATAPAVVVYTAWPTSQHALGPASFAVHVFALLPLLTAIAGFGLAANAIQRESDEGSWSVLSLAPTSNAGYLLRRWISSALLLIPVTALPLGVAALLASLRWGSLDPGMFFWPWLLLVVPVALAATAAGIGLGTVGRGLIGGILIGGIVFGLLLPALGVPGLDKWLQLTEATYTLTGVKNSLLGSGTSAFPLPVSEAPYDPGTAAQQYLSLAAVPLGVSALLMALACLFMGRMRRDLRPWKVEAGQSLSSFRKRFNRLRLEYAVDAGLSRGDRGLALLGVVLLAAAVGFQVVRSSHYREVAQRRLEAVRAEASPMPAEVVVPRVSLQGRIGVDGQVRTRVSIEVENRGREPVSTLAFLLAPELRVLSLETSGGAAEHGSTWDRLDIELDRPLAAGSSTTLTFELEGTPSRDALPLRNWVGSDRGLVVGGGFEAAYRSLGSDPDLSRSYTVPGVSERRLALVATDLMPVPRRAPLDRGGSIEALDVSGRARVDRGSSAPADVEVDLEVPADLFVADACGGVVPRDRADRRLESRCRLSPAELAVVGGRYVVLSHEGTPTVAVFERHAELGRIHFASIEETQRSIEERWPSLAGDAARVIVEWPEPSVHNLDTRFFQDWFADEKYDPSVSTKLGRLLLVAERRIARRQPLTMASILARSVGTDLLARRPVPPEEEMVFRRAYEEIGRQSLGLAPEARAVVPRFAGGPSPVMVPLVEAEADDARYWRNRFPALIFGLRESAGPDAIATAVDRFTEGSGTGSFDELLSRMQETGGPELDRFVEQFVRQGNLPFVALDDVRVERLGGSGWRVTGAVVNHGTGEAACLVELQTEVSSVDTEVSAGSETEGRFELTTQHAPLTLVIDPDRSCHRYANATPVPAERVDLVGLRSP